MQHVLKVAFGPAPDAATTHFAFLLLDGFTHLAFACAMEPLRLANLALGRTVYGWRVLTPTGEPVQCSSGVVVAAESTMAGIIRNERLVVVAGGPVSALQRKQVVPFLRREAVHGRTVSGICGGVHVLAEAGLLDGLECAVHWQVAPGFAERFPKVSPRLSAFVTGKVSTASGGTAAADLMLHAIRSDHGTDVAQSVADLMVHRGVRGADAPQTSSLLSHIRGRNRKLAQIVAAMENNIDCPLGAGELADLAQISVRQMERLFTRYLGATPVRYYQELRLTRAQDLLHQTDLSIIEIATATGFGSASHFAKRFRQRYNVSAYASRHDRSALQTNNGPSARRETVSIFSVVGSYAQV